MGQVWDQGFYLLKNIVFVLTFVIGPVMTAVAANSNYCVFRAQVDCIAQVVECLKEDVAKVFLLCP